MTTPRVLSIVLDTNNHTIERLATPPNALHISPTKGTTPIPHDEAAATAAWYWLHVGLKDGEYGTQPGESPDDLETVF